MPKSWGERAETWLVKRRLDYLRTVIGTEIEEDLVAVAQGLGWLKEGQSTWDITAEKLFPNVDLRELERQVRDRELGEKEASKIADARAADDVANIRKLVFEHCGKTKHRVGVATPPKVIPNPDAIVTLTGIPKARPQNNIILYGFNIGGKDVYAFVDDAAWLGQAIDENKEVNIECQQAKWWCLAQQMTVL